MDELKTLSWCAIHKGSPKNPIQRDKIINWLCDKLRIYGVKINKSVEFYGSGTVVWGFGSSTEASEKRRFYLDNDYHQNWTVHGRYEKADNRFGFKMEFDNDVSFIPAIDGVDKRRPTVVFAFHKF